MPAISVVIVVKNIAQRIADAMLSENWFSDRWSDIKAATGIGQDSLGLGKNTEKGWKPKYSANKKSSAKNYPRRNSGEGDTKTWEIG